MQCRLHQQQYLFSFPKYSPSYIQKYILDAAQRKLFISFVIKIIIITFPNYITYFQVPMVNVQRLLRLQQCCYLFIIVRIFNKQNVLDLQTGTLRITAIVIYDLHHFLWPCNIIILISRAIQYMSKSLVRLHPLLLSIYSVLQTFA